MLPCFRCHYPHFFVLVVEIAFRPQDGKYYCVFRVFFFSVLSQAFCRYNDVTCFSLDGDPRYPHTRARVQYRDSFLSFHPNPSPPCALTSRVRLSSARLCACVLSLFPHLSGGQNEPDPPHDPPDAVVRRPQGERYLSRKNRGILSKNLLRKYSGSSVFRKDNGGRSK